MAKIVFDEEKCIGCGTCAAVCPENWEMQGDKAKAKSLEVTEVGCNQQAADSCPVSCIRIE